MSESTILTPRQRQVLYGIAAGLCTREIAEQLGTSPRTTEIHRMAISKRLRSRNVVEVLRAAVKAKLLPSNVLAVPVSTLLKKLSVHGKGA